MHPAAKAKFLAEQIEASKRGARNIECKRCGAPCWQGEDDDNMSLTVTVDAEPLAPVDEMFARLDGRMTFDLVRARGKTAKHGQRNLHTRDDFQLAAVRKEGTVHVEHRCERNTQR